MFTYIHRRYGGHVGNTYEVRRFIPGENRIYVTDEPDPEA